MSGKGTVESILKEVECFVLLGPTKLLPVTPGILIAPNREPLQQSSSASSMSTKFDEPATASPPPNAVAYEARRSQRVSADLAPSDGDVWQEKLAVCEGVHGDTGEPRLLIRSYYRNLRTQERVWDEPPSGAGTVLHADQEMRAKAEEQKLELQLTLQMIPPDEAEEEEELPSSSSENNKNGKSKKKSIFRRFSRKTKPAKNNKEVDNSRDLNLQRAIARSMADQMGIRGGGGGENGDEPVIYFDDGEPTQRSPSHVNREEEDLELAKALSISAAQQQQEPSSGVGDGAINLTEEEMFQRALEKSRHEARTAGAYGVASMPDPSSSLVDSFTSFSVSPSSPKPVVVGLKSDPDVFDDDDDLDQKLPAAPSLAKQFDPYGS